MRGALLVIMGIYPFVVRSQTGLQAKALRTKLFDTDGYDKKILPAVDQTDAKGMGVNAIFNTKWLFPRRACL